MKRYTSVDDYIDGSEFWRDELMRLRQILTSTELDETVKWGSPCYTFQDKNVVGIGAFKSYFGLWFFQGALLADKEHVLINAQEGRTKALRQWRFGSGNGIKVRLIKSYVAEAIKLQSKGLVIKSDRAKPLQIPAQLKAALTNNKRAKSRFEALTKGKQREFAGYISSAKRDDTKVNRIKKILPMIVAGQGLNDKYRNS